MIITAAAGLISFGGAFAVGWLTQATKPAPRDEPDNGELAELRTFGLPHTELDELDMAGSASDTTKTRMTKKQLKSLVHEVRENMEAYDNKLKGLKAYEQRLERTQQVLEEDIERLNNLRTELASMVARLKAEQEQLLNSRLEIAQSEKANLMSIAAAYDKMDAASASKILTNMCAAARAQIQKATDAGKASNMDDAVKILHYMAERTKAKVLAELVTSEPTLTAVLCQRLKQVTEQE